MNKNEIGQFPYLPPQNQFDKGGYPRTYIAKDEKGKLALGVDGNIKWANNWKIISDIELIDIPDNTLYGELLIDLQTACDCYCANILEVNGIQYIKLTGSGWAETGFPFYDDTITEKHLYETGRGCYALIRGKAKDRFIKIAKKGCIPSFKDIFTDYQKDFCLPK